MDSILYTIGFTQKTADEFFRLLADAGIRKVIDVRENRVGQLQGFARFPDIAYFLQRIVGAGYVHEPLFAPAPEIRKAYRSTRNWEQYEKSFLQLMDQRRVLEQIKPADFEGKVALLCSEAAPEKCHRRLVAELLVQHFQAMGHSAEVRHLVLDKPKKGIRRARKANDRASAV